MKPRFLFDQPSLTTVLLLFPASLHQERIPIHVVDQITDCVVLAPPCQSDASHDVHTHLAHSSERVLHPHADAAAQGAGAADRRDTAGAAGANGARRAGAAR